MTGGERRQLGPHVLAATELLRVLTADEAVISRGDLFLARCYEQHPRWVAQRSVTELAAAALSGGTHPMG